MVDERVPTWLRTLRLGAFRNYAVLSLDLNAGPVILAGPNGAGKTNLLEAVSFLAPGRGLRGARLGDIGLRTTGACTAPVAGLPPGGWSVSATMMEGREEVRLGTAVEFSGAGALRRIAKRDHSVIALNELAACLGIIWLTPQQDRLFTESPSGRRRFLDRIILSRDPEHASRVATYDRAMRERQRILCDPQADRVWLEALEIQMVEAGIAISAAREDLVVSLSRLCEDHAVDGFPVPGFALTGEIEQLLVQSTALEAEESFAARLRDARQKDAFSGRTQFGPHVSDLTVTNKTSGLDARDCSTGEQKALLISIVLASARLAALRRRGASPLVLLDEVAAHLDEGRRGQLFDAVCALGCQVWMTGTDFCLFEALDGRAHFFEVKSGAVEEKSAHAPLRAFGHG